MANKFAIATGNWSNAAIWNDGVVPTTGDDVWCNSFTVTLNTDVSVKSLRSNTSPNILPNMPVPLMTSNTTPSGVANAGVNATTAFNVFDQDPLTSWTSTAGSLGTTAWVSYQLTSGMVAKKYYMLRPTTTTSKPSGWVFQGSNDGSTWTTLDTVTGDATLGGYTSGTLANTTSYTYYRILVNTVSVGTSAQIFTFEFTNDTTSAVGGQNGGSFLVNTGRTITCSDTTNGLTAGSAPCLLINSTGATININSTVRGGTTTSLISTINLPTNYNNNTINIVGNIETNTISSTSTSIITNASNNTIINVTGNTICSNATNGINSTTVGSNVTINVVGNLSTTSAGNPIVMSSSGSLTVTGVLSNTSTGEIIVIGGGATTIINGDVIGGGGNSVSCISYTTSVGTLTINGNVVGGSQASAISTNIGSTIIVNGNITAGAFNGVSCTSIAATVIINGTMVNSNTRMAVYASNIEIKNGGSVPSWLFKDESTNNYYLYPAGTSLGNPATTDVRDGVTYASGSLTGTLKVPPTSSVSVGVPVDNTTGTGIFTITDMGTLLSSYVV